MRTIIIASGAIELLLVVAASLFAGPRVTSIIRAAASRCSNVIIVGVLALACWVAAGIAVNSAVLLLPGDGQFVTGPLRAGDIEFNINVFVPMVLISFGLMYLFAQAAIAAGRGRGLRESLRIGGGPIRPSLAHGDVTDGHEMLGALVRAGDVGTAVEDRDADLVVARR